MCSACSGFFSKKTISLHFKNCSANSSASNPIDAEPLKINYVFEDKLSDQFDIDVIGALSSDEIGNYVSGSNFLKSIGRCIYNSKYSQAHKNKGNASNVRQNLRILANLFIHFRHTLAEKIKVDPESIMIEEMFQRQTRFVEGISSINLKVLEEVVENVSDSGSNARAKIYWTLMKATNILSGIYSTNCQDDLVTELNFFKNALKCNGSTAGIFADAIHAPHYVREFKLRKPGNLPTSDDVMRVRDFVVHEIQKLVNFELDPKNIDFVFLRQLLITRLTFLNGRRGGEASRLTKNQYEVAKRNEWINNEMKDLIKDSAELNLLEKYKLAYLCGKGKSVVPLLIPSDSLKAIDLLCDEDFRMTAGVNADNTFVFPATRDRKYNVTGSCDISSIMTKVGLDKPVTATQMRHFISTKYSYEHSSKEDLYYFSLHFGHDREINQKIYQCPLSVQEIIRVGGVLDTLDEKLGKKILLLRVEQK